MHAICNTSTQNIRRLFVYRSLFLAGEILYPSNYSEPNLFFNIMKLNVVNAKLLSAIIHHMSPAVIPNCNANIRPSSLPFSS